MSALALHAVLPRLAAGSGGRWCGAVQPPEDTVRRIRCALSERCKPASDDGWNVWRLRWTQTGLLECGVTRQAVNSQSLLPLPLP